MVVPVGITQTAWPATRDTLRNLGVEFDQWQQDLARLVLAQRRDGKFAASVGGVVLSIPRQVGKTFLVGMIVFAQCLLRPGVKAIWTAHHTDTSDETFDAMRELAMMPTFRPHVRKILTGGGAAEIIFTNKSRIEFGARGAGSGFGRGKTKVSIIVLDEFQHVSEGALENITPTANQGDNPLIFMMGTPPRPIDNGEAFKNKRRRAGAGSTKDVLFVEIGADRGATLDDREQWAKANPSYPRRTPEDAFLRMMENLGSDDSFRREALGIWDEDEPGSRLIPADLWAKRAVESKPEGTASYGVAFSKDGSRVSLAGAVKHDDGVHVELLDATSGPVDASISALADWLAGCWQETAQIVISGGAGDGVLYQALRDRKVPDAVITKATTPAYTTACAMFWADLQEGTATHLESDGQAVLDGSVAICDQKQRGSAWGWQATTPDGDETPLEAVSLALWGAKTTRRKPNQKQRAVIRR